MNSWLEIALLAGVLLLLLPLLVLAIEVLAALLPAPRSNAPGSPLPGTRCAILIPAHNEEAGLGATLASIAEQLRPADRLLVVADNCTDRTAEVARLAGAEVVERSDPARRGKGFALDCGVRALEGSPPDVVVVIDADCLARPGAIDQLAREAWRTGRPVQAVYLLEPPLGAGVLAQLSAFAFRFKNLVRPLGLARLGFPCLLTGSGMAFPWRLLSGVCLASGNIVEDMQLGLDLACAGHPPKLCPEARVDGVLPVGRGSACRQRTRWEHGHLRTLLTQVPRLLLAAEPAAAAGPAGAGPGAERSPSVGAGVVVCGPGVRLVPWRSGLVFRRAGGVSPRSPGGPHPGLGGTCCRGGVPHRLGPVWPEQLALYLLAGCPLVRPRQGADSPCLPLAAAAGLGPHRARDWATSGSRIERSCGFRG